MWICENDRYALDPSPFETIEEFETCVREAFPDECEGFELTEGTDRNGAPVVRDEHGEVALRWVTAENC